MWGYYALRAAILLVAPLPERLGIIIANVVADGVFILARKSRATVEANITQVLGPETPRKELRRVTRQVSHTLARNYLDLIRLPRCDPRRLNDRVRILGLEHLQAAQQRGKGVVMATAHLGNFDLLAQVAAAWSTAFTVLVEPLEPARMYELVTKLRGSQGVRFVPADSGGIKAAFRALRNGELVGVACDRAIEGKGVMAKFMGKETPLPTAAVELAMRTGAAVMPIFAVRLRHGGYEIHMEPAMLFGDGPADGDAVRAAVEKIAGVMERYIRLNPGQWVLTSQVWPGNGNGSGD